DDLSEKGVNAMPLHGDMQQRERNRVVQWLRDGRVDVLVATDVAARGIDLPGLELVVHADLPTNAETLLHRSGRTGRAGNKGLCVLLVPYNRRRGIQRLLGENNVEATWAQPPSAAEIVAADRKRILNDETLQGELTDDEKAFATKLLEKHGAETVAAAYLRLHQKNRPAPEEMLDVAADGDRAPEPSGYGRKTPREGFATEGQGREGRGGVWFSISAGHKQNAEPRWLLPLICRVGHITRKDVGTIKIFHTESRFEVTAEVAERFIQTVEREGTGEKKITITRAAGAPPETASPPREKKAWIPEKEFRAQRDARPDARPGERFGAGKPWKKRERSGEGEFQPDRPPAKTGKPNPGGWSKPKKKQP
ncbi:MAG: C-terminal helicase domain-containing protein, partial [Ferrovibrio sp.]